MTERLRRVLPALVFLVVFLCFCPSLENGFVWDDRDNFLNNVHYRGFSGATLTWIFTEYHGHYIPVTWLTLALDYTLWGMRPAGYHLTNLLLHGANALLFYGLSLALLRRVVGEAGPRLAWAAAVSALFFAIHPLRVESVAWVTERRDVVSGFFVLLTVLAYLKMQEAPRAKRRIAWLTSSVACFLLSLMSKTTGMALPIVLLLLDVYPLGRFSRGPRVRVWVEKIPYAVLMLAAVGLTYVTQKEAGALLVAADYPMLDRVMQPGFRFCFYVWKTVLPVSLSPLYFFRNTPDLWDVTYLGCAVGVASATAVLVLFRRQCRALWVTWLSYGVMISPVVGIFQAGPHFAADRYTYLACMPWAVLAGAGWIRLSRRSVTLGAILSICVLFALGLSTARQTKVWRDELSVWEQAVRVDPNPFAYNNRGTARKERGDWDGAIADYTEAIRLHADYSIAYYNRATANREQGRAQEAVADYREAIRINPRYAAAYYYRGVLRRAGGDTDGAIVDYSRAIEIEPRAEAYFNRAVAFQDQGEPDRAAADLTQAIRLFPEFADAYTNRAGLRKQQGDLEGALADYDEAVRLEPTLAVGYYNRGLARSARGDFSEAIADFGEAIRLDPRAPAAYTYRGILKMEHGRKEEAARDFKKALEVAPPEWTARAQVERMLGEAERR